MTTIDDQIDCRLGALLELLPLIDGLLASEIEEHILALSPDVLDNPGRHFAFKDIVRLMQVNAQRGKNVPQNILQAPPPAPLQNASRLESAPTPETPESPGRPWIDSRQHIPNGRSLKGPRIVDSSRPRHSRHDALTPSPRRSRACKTEGERMTWDETRVPKGVSDGVKSPTSDHVVATITPSARDTWLRLSELARGTRRRDLRRYIESAGFGFDEASFRFQNDQHAFDKVPRDQANLMISTLHQKPLRWGARMDVHLANPEACKCWKKIDRSVSGPHNLYAAPVRDVGKGFEGSREPGHQQPSYKESQVVTRAQEARDMIPKGARLVWLRFDHPDHIMRKRDLQRSLEDYLIDEESIQIHDNVHGFVQMPAGEAHLILETLNNRTTMRVADPAGCKCSLGRGDRNSPGRGSSNPQRMPGRARTSLDKEDDTRHADRYAGERRSRSPQRPRSRDMEQRIEHRRSPEYDVDRYRKYRDDRDTSQRERRRSISPERTQPRSPLTGRPKVALSADVLGRIPDCVNCHRDGRDCDGKTVCNRCRSLFHSHCEYVMCREPSSCTNQHCIYQHRWDTKTDPDRRASELRSTRSRASQTKTPRLNH